MTNEPTEIAVVEHDGGGLVQHDPTAALLNTEKLVQYMADKCNDERFISIIQGRKYPRVEWWTTVGLALGLQPVEVSSKKIEFDGGYMYEAIVEVRRNNQVITRASAICSTQESAWGKRDEYAVKSMAGTRATGKAYRIGLSALAVLAGLEPTPADEIPPQGFGNAPADKGHGICPIHNVPFNQSDAQRNAGFAPSHKQGNGWCNKDDVMDAIADAQPQEQPSPIAEARDVLTQLYDDPDQRMKYVADVVGRDIHLPADVTEEEWIKVKQSATEDLMSMMEGE